jgi:hypothetical protein
MTIEEVLEMWTKTPPTRICRNVVLSTTRATEIKIGRHLHLSISSLDDTILICNSGIYDPTAMQPFIDAGDSITLDGDTQTMLILQAQTVPGARVRIITW